METRKLVPYNLYLYADHVEKLKKMAGDRKVSSFVRDAVSTLLDGNTEYSAGYNRALKDVIDVINGCKEIDVIAIRGKYLADILIDEVQGMEK